MLRQASVEFLEAFILAQEMRARRYPARAPSTTRSCWIRATSPSPGWW